MGISFKDSLYAQDEFHIPSFSNHQIKDSIKTLKSRPPVEADFLINYYQQDGDHSAVTGGRGTESLNDIATTIIIKIPVDSLSRAILSPGFSHYSSASTDMINSHMSSASRRDNRAKIDLTYERDNKAQTSTVGFTAGMSIESDYLSKTLAAYWNKSFSDDNQYISFAGIVNFDKWIMIFPEEVRDVGHLLLDTDKRNTYTLAGTYSKVLNKRLTASVHLDLVYQKGLISTPFHRVYFNNDSLSLERLPGYRLKIPAGFRLNYFASDRFVFRFFYRYFRDSFGINAHTVNLELPVKTSPYLTLYPFYRYYSQSAADDFRPFEEHAPGSKYQTSDYDLSGFSSHKVGVGLRYAPLYGIKFGNRSQEKVSNLNSINFRMAYYMRSDGLWAFMAGSGFSFSF